VRISSPSGVKQVDAPADTHEGEQDSAQDVQGYVKPKCERAFFAAVLSEAIGDLIPSQ
jgi:hypothetical protein